MIAKIYFYTIYCIEQKKFSKKAELFLYYCDKF